MAGARDKRCICFSDAERESETPPIPSNLPCLSADKPSKKRPIPGVSFSVGGKKKKRQKQTNKSCEHCRNNLSWSCKVNMPDVIWSGCAEEMNFGIGLTTNAKIFNFDIFKLTSKYFY